MTKSLVADDAEIKEPTHPITIFLWLLLLVCIVPIVALFELLIRGTLYAWKHKKDVFQFTMKIVKKFRSMKR